MSIVADVFINTTSRACHFVHRRIRNFYTIQLLVAFKREIGGRNSLGCQCARGGTGAERARTGAQRLAGRRGLRPAVTSADSQRQRREDTLGARRGYRRGECPDDPVEAIRWRRSGGLANWFTFAIGHSTDRPRFLRLIRCDQDQRIYHSPNCKHSLRSEEFALRSARRSKR